MLRILGRLRVGKLKADPHGFSQIDGVRSLESRADEMDAESVVTKKVFQSKSIRQRRRRNIMKRIYGSGYDHGMDGYR